MVEKSVQIRIETINPEKAEEYLKLNAHNRRVIPRDVDGIAFDMSNGKWVFNGEPIRFNKIGMLFDGQHRLLALIKANATLEFVVIRELPEGAFKTTDIGRKRSMPDLLSIEGKSHPHQLASTLSYVLRYRKYKNFLARKELMTPAEKFEILFLNPEIEPLIRAYAAKDYPLKTSGAVLAACHYLLREKNLEQADFYMGGITMGEDLKESDMTYIVRNWIIRKYTGKTSPRFAEITANVILRGWNYFRKGEKVGEFRNLESRIPIEII